MFLLSFTIGFVIYSYSYYKIGNTLHRIDSSGEKKWNFTQLITTGIYQPIRLAHLYWITNNMKLFIKEYFIKPYNPWYTIPLTIIILHLPLQILYQYLFHHH